MTFFSLFAPSVAALNGHSAALQSIGVNISNATTTGYKEVETRFSEIVNDAPGATFGNFGGMRPRDQFFISQQGEAAFTGRALDVAIVGDGFLVTNPAFDASGELQLTRAGALDIANVDGADQAFLVDQTGNFVFGWPSDGVGGFLSANNLASLEPIRVDAGSEFIQASPTTSARARVNLDAEAEAGAGFNSSVAVVDSTGAGHTLTLDWTKDAALNSWTLNATVSDAIVTGGTPAPMTFDADGLLVGPASLTLDVAYADPAAAAGSIAVDLSGITQFAGDFSISDMRADGRTSGNLNEVEIVKDGIVRGFFTNGATRDLYKLALATVPNPDALGHRSGTHFVLSERSGDLTLHEANQTALAVMEGGLLESSTVDIGEQFTTMIVTQRAYNSSAQALRAVNEMVQLAAAMKV